MLQNKTIFSTCNRMTLADFHLWEMLDQHENFYQLVDMISPLKNYLCLSKFYQIVRCDYKLKIYFESKYYKKFAMNNPHANFLH